MSQSEDDDSMYEFLTRGGIEDFLGGAFPIAVLFLGALATIAYVSGNQRYRRLIGTITFASAFLASSVSLMAAEAGLEQALGWALLSVFGGVAALALKSSGGDGQAPQRAFPQAPRHDPMTGYQQPTPQPQQWQTGQTAAYPQPQQPAAEPQYPQQPPHTEHQNP